MIDPKTLTDEDYRRTVIVSGREGLITGTDGHWIWVKCGDAPDSMPCSPEEVSFKSE